ncbi:tripartite motif-containing protein 16-like [Megalops cyprinoides]|uniref:tripartite motif-containing protein 16-like n=1 Tax=Megalops cyprinoides TaxID=118141 RepID=UPI0018642FFE|nr:tripartite motif-containing protein 16-like [Megalops cyprinoides]
MAQSTISVDQDEFSCLICLGVLKDPVTILCGHSYCMSCIKNCWDKNDPVGDYSCPQCQRTFRPRPPLFKNVMLADMIDKMKRTGPGIVACDVCPGAAQRAAKSCLACMASYCETHLRPHHESPALQKHKLIDATGKLQEMVCPLHGKLLEVYCRTDRRCVCLLCVMDEHKHHDTVSAVAEWTEKQKEVAAEKRISQQKIQQREKELQNVRQAVESLSRTAQTAVGDSEKAFSDLVCLFKKWCSKVKKAIKDQERAVTCWARGLPERLEQEIADLRAREAELERLSHAEDHIHFLQSWQPPCARPGSSDPPCVNVGPHLSFESVSRAVSELKKRVEKVCEEEFIKILEEVSIVNKEDVRPPAKRKAGAAVSPVFKVNAVDGPSPKRKAKAAVLPVFKVNAVDGPSPKQKAKAAVLPVNAINFPQIPEPRTRAEFLQYAYWLTLDSNTAHKELTLSGGDRVVKRTGPNRKCPPHPERFTFKCQVLCREALAGRRFYWEAEVQGKEAEIGLTYKGINRRGRDRSSSFGGNTKSWSLDCRNSAYSVCYNNNGLQLAVPYCPKIGVYLDHPAGILSFYSVSDIMTLIYRTSTVTFTEPVYAGFWIGEQCTVKLVNL